MTTLKEEKLELDAAAIKIARGRETARLQAARAETNGPPVEGFQGVSDGKS